MPASADEIANFKAIAGDYIHDYVAIQYIDNSGSLADAIGKIFDEPELYTIQTVCLTGPRILLSTDWHSTNTTYSNNSNPRSGTKDLLDRIDLVKTKLAAGYPVCPTVL
jgi:hypothetical protein